MPHALIVDDQADNRYYLEVLLQAAGFSTTSAVNGQQGLDLARQQPPDVAIVDLLMPVMDGYRMLQLWRHDPLLQQRPFVVYTATYTDPEDEKLALSLGANVFLRKPAEPDVVLAAIHDALQRTPVVAAPVPAADDPELLQSYNQALVRKLESRSQQLEAANARLERDLVRRELAEAALRLNEERFRLLAQAINDAIWDWDISVNTRWWNEGLERTFGHPAPEVSSDAQWAELVHPADRSRVMAERQRLLEGTATTWQVRYRFRHRQGYWITVEDRAHVVRDATGAPRRMVGGLADIRQHLALEEQLWRAQRLEAVGELTGGLAHDFNNLLTIILGNANFLQEELAAHPELAGAADMIVTAADRGAEITRRLLGFARPGSLAPEAVALAPLLHDVTGLLQQALGSQVQMQLVCPERLPSALVDPGQLEQALLNLCVNARDATSGEGTVTLAVDTARAPSADPGVPVHLPPGNYLVIAVIDHGAGIEPHHLPRIFDPFYTTKPSARGSGLGLAMVHAFAQRSGGAITVQSTPGHGSVFTLFLPAIDAATPASPSP